MGMAVKKIAYGEQPEMSIIRNWALKSKNTKVLKIAYLYNRLKDKIGLEEGFGSIIDPSEGRALEYQKKIVDLAAYRLQKKFENGSMVYNFFKKGEEHPELEKLSKDQLKTLLGGKGYGLYLMKCVLGMPVPAFSTLPAWMYSKLKNGKLTEEQKAAIISSLEDMEKATGKKFGDADNPLFVSCRSGAKASMPGMMETVLNLGMTKELVKELVKKNPEKACFWLDSYCTFLAQFGDVVFGISDQLAEKGKEVVDVFEKAKEELKKKKGVLDDTQLTAEDLHDLIKTYEGFYQKAEKVLPTDWKEQCILAAETVFASFNKPRAQFARKEMGIPDYIGTAVNFVEMVFGNKGPLSGTGVLFTRDNTTGENRVYGNVLFNAQGEQVVAGVRDALPLEALRDHEDKRIQAIYPQLIKMVKELEDYCRDMQDVEFTIEQDKEDNPILYLLQTRDGKRSGEAAIKIAMDLYREGKITAKEAIMRVEPDKFREILYPKFDPEEYKEAIKAGRMLGKGTPGTLGAGTGKIIFDPKKLVELARVEAGKPEEERQNYILIRPMTMQDDVKGMRASKGVLTKTGSKVCHAVIMTTMWGIPCVVAFKDMEFIEEGGVITGIKIKGKTCREGDEFSINGTTGEVFAGKIKTIKPKEMNEDAKALLELADGFKKLEVRANTEVDTAKLSLDFGAKGVGLVRTEHMFLDEKRLHNVRLVLFKYLEYVSITEDTEAAETRKDEIMKQLVQWLAELGKSQEEDFYRIYKIFDGYGVTSRLLDAPLHEFLPKKEEDYKCLESDLGVNRETLKQRLEKFHETNPMLGFRSARMGIVFPEIYKTQVRSMLRAAGKLIDEGKNPKVEIEIPLVSEIKEIEIIKGLVADAAEEITKERQGKKVPYRLGIMVETPAAALNGKRVAQVLGPDGFASVGTNDLTQTGKALSRDDAEFFLQLYAELNFYNYGKRHPFLSLDPDVVRLMATFAAEARSVYPHFEIGICGEHGGDPYSIGILHRIGWDIISMSAYSVPPSRLAAGRAALEEEEENKKLPLTQVLMAGIR